MNRNIFEAIDKGDHEALRENFGSINVNKSNSDGYTPLYYACMKKGVGVKTVQEIILLGAEVDMKGADRETPLYIACFNGKLDVALVLLDEGADIDARNGTDGETALHVAARTGNCALINILVERGAGLNPQNIRKETPLYLAAKGGYHNAVYHLLKAGVNTNICDIDGKSPLYIASEKGHKHVVILLKSNRNDLALAKAKADEELRLHPLPIKSTEEIYEKAAEDAAAGRPIRHISIDPEPERVTRPLDVVEIVVPQAKWGMHNPFGALPEGPCRSLEEVGYDEPPSIPASLRNLPPVKPQRIGGTSMRIGTSIDTVGVEPIRVNSLLGDSLQFSRPLNK
ncbi:Ankyrin repeat-containing domain [Trypanosoma melophagium]|uniref:Ankyrin repeat-containing domain n=1 Tax=Trypanosoma melophagium TaxID=715481 RepID=UPI00351AAB57|nr:Ankyrin repeat-containing domain [Trypanosoma melophagium]